MDELTESVKTGMNGHAASVEETAAIVIPAMPDAGAAPAKQLSPEEKQAVVDELARMSASEFIEVKKARAAELGHSQSDLAKLVSERRKALKAEASAERSNRRQSGIDWPETTRDGDVRKRSQANIAAFLDSRGVELAHDEFAYRTVIRRNGRETILDDGSAESLWLEADRAGLAAAQPYFYAVLGDTARRNGFHPVRDYLDGLEWDGTPRIDNWLHEYLGAIDPDPDLPEPADAASQEEKIAYCKQAYQMRELVQQYSRKTLIGAVRRVRRPGCKHDTMLVLHGLQGRGKSTVVKSLCPNKDWYTDSLKVGEGKKGVLELTEGVWIVEFPELAGLGKRAFDEVKAMLSGERDDARKAYGKFTTRRERQFISIGTINEDEFLQDPTGNRRYWTVSLDDDRDGDEDIARTIRDRDQLWAEADHYVRQGEDSTLPKHLWPIAAIEQRSRRISDPWEDKLKHLIDDRDYVSRDAVYAELGMETQHLNPQVGKRISGIMTAAGFKTCQPRTASGGRERGYQRRA